MSMSRRLPQTRTTREALPWYGPDVAAITSFQGSSTSRGGSPGTSSIRSPLRLPLRSPWSRRWRRALYRSIGFRRNRSLGSAADDWTWRKPRSHELGTWICFSSTSPAEAVASFTPSWPMLSRVSR